MKWIIGNGRYWHLARERELRGAKSNEVMYRYDVAACTGRNLGGAWGHRSRKDQPKQDACPRCASLLRKEQP